MYVIVIAHTHLCNSIVLCLVWEQGEKVCCKLVYWYVVPFLRRSWPEQTAASSTFSRWSQCRQSVSVPHHVDAQQVHINLASILKVSWASSSFYAAVRWRLLHDAPIRASWTQRRQWRSIPDSIPEGKHSHMLWQQVDLRVRVQLHCIFPSTWRCYQSKDVDPA